MQLKKFFERWFPSDIERTLQEIERRLEYVPYVKVSAADHDEGVEGTLYYVTKIDRKGGYLHYFNPYNHANMATCYVRFGSLSCTPDQDPSELERHSFINNHIWGIYKSNRGTRGNKYRQRLGWDINSNPIYIRNGLHCYEGTAEERTRWGDTAMFLVAALEVDKGGPHVEAFSYYPGYGTLGFRVDIGGWEADPRFIDYDQQHRDKLHAEYLAYKKSPPFQEGDIIKSPGFPERVFIRYEDRDRTRMIVFPGKLIEGADNIARFVLLERKGVPVD